MEQGQNHGAAMRAVIQRVTSASVSVDGRISGAIALGFLVYLGVGRDDTDADIEYIARKIGSLRVFEDADGKMNLALDQVRGEVLLVSQFTLYGDVRKGNRPAFDAAAPPDQARAIYAALAAKLRDIGIAVAEGIFQADMRVESVNQGPVTILLESGKLF
jgi:D-aminoacyl-tRNA deacylase